MQRPDDEFECSGLLHILRERAHQSEGASDVLLCLRSFLQTLMIWMSRSRVGARRGEQARSGADARPKCQVRDAEHD